jgi:hypothetical protein
MKGMEDVERGAKKSGGQGTGENMGPSEGEFERFYPEGAERPDRHHLDQISRQLKAYDLQVTIGG